MPLPLIFVPGGLPCVLASGHSVAPADVFDLVPMKQGEGRKRRVFTIAPRVVGAGWVLSSDEREVFDAWFEDTLDRGQRQFTLEVAKLGPGREFWAAEWLGGDDGPPYTAEPLAKGFWRVLGAVLLTGSPSDTPPETGALALDIVVSLGASASLTVPAPLALDIVVSLGTTAPLALDIVVSLGLVDNGAPADDVLSDLRWVLMGYPWAPGYTAEVTDDEAAERSWIELRDLTWL